MDRITDLLKLSQKDHRLTAAALAGSQWHFDICLVCRNHFVVQHIDPDTGKVFDFANIACVDDVRVFLEFMERRMERNDFAVLSAQLDACTDGWEQVEPHQAEAAFRAFSRLPTNVGDLLRVHPDSPGFVNAGFMGALKIRLELCQHCGEHVTAYAYGPGVDEGIVLATVCSQEDARALVQWFAENELFWRDCLVTLRDQFDAIKTLPADTPREENIARFNVKHAPPSISIEFIRLGGGSDVGLEEFFDATAVQDIPGGMRFGSSIIEHLIMAAVLDDGTDPAEDGSPDPAA